MPFLGDRLVPWRVSNTFQFQLPFEIRFSVFHRRLSPPRIVSVDCRAEVGVSAGCFGGASGWRFELLGFVLFFCCWKVSCVFFCIVVCFSIIIPNGVITLNGQKSRRAFFDEITPYFWGPHFTPFITVPGPNVGPHSSEQVFCLWIKPMFGWIGWKSRNNGQ